MQFPWVVGVVVVEGVVVVMDVWCQGEASSASSEGAEWSPRATTATALTVSSSGSAPMNRPTLLSMSVLENTKLKLNK